MGSPYRAPAASGHAAAPPKSEMKNASAAFSESTGGLL